MVQKCIKRNVQRTELSEWVGEGHQNGLEHILVLEFSKSEKFHE